ncbi:dUTP diphosphatase [Jiella sp. MQZ9-1]|uniref:Deoxyuridine 5'-triphosphate nucleotidohydrolase n=1 Tax=Jiella flava TaxID=2816857 RepID=A0A939FWM2_9HYPH|nr:dUTP diphosphatase [Jiella flava]MBO0661525.1 dUTP diphosphatase [Jiella flava]MCD2470167.1 dUTP diphosphatase [Jiella flava]
MTMNEQTVQIGVRRLENGLDAELPSYSSAGAAGADLRASLDGPLELAPGERALVPTGLAVELPDGFEMQIRPRSGLAVRHGVTVLNSPGTVDSDYRGEVKVLLVNLGEEPVAIEPGDRIAQAVIAPVTRAVFTLAETLSDTTRGTGGFGSTGRR